jgi:hypothetical protein
MAISALQIHATQRVVKLRKIFYTKYSRPSPLVMSFTDNMGSPQIVTFEEAATYTLVPLLHERYSLPPYLYSNVY